MADITENHITALEAGGVLAKSVLAAEVNFATTALDIVNKEKNTTTCKLTVNHVATPTDEKVPFVDQWWTFTGVDGAKFDGTYKCTAVTVNSSTQTIIHYEHPVSETVGSTVISIAGGAVPFNAIGLTTTNKFGLNNSLTSASDSASNKNQVMISGRRAVYYTNLANANAMFTSDTFSANFVVDMTMQRPGNAGTGTVDMGLLLMQSTGTNSGDCLFLNFLGAFTPYFYDASANTKTALVANTHYTGVGIVGGAAALPQTTKTTMSFEITISGGTVTKIRVVRDRTAEMANLDLTAGDWKLVAPIYVGDCSGMIINADAPITTYKIISDAFTVRLT